MGTFCSSWSRASEVECSALKIMTEFVQCVGSAGNLPADQDYIKDSKPEHWYTCTV
jgi:hypothetical protein